MEYERDYKKEYENYKKNNKVYTVKIPKYIANILDEKLQKENKTFTGLVKDAFDKFLKKN